MSDPQLPQVVSVPNTVSPGAMVADVAIVVTVIFSLFSVIKF